MATLVRMLEALALAALTVLLCKVTLFLSAVEPKVLVTVENADRAMIAAGAAAGNVEKASRQWQASSKAQAADVNKALRSMGDTVGALNALVTGIDQSLNGGIFPKVRDVLEVQNANLARVEAQTQNLLADADQQINNPSISASLANLDAVTLESAQVAQNVHAETDLILGQTRKAFEPENKFKSIAKMMLEGTLNGASLYYYLTH